MENKWDADSYHVCVIFLTHVRLRRHHSGSGLNALWKVVIPEV